MDSNVDILRESSKFKARFARISIAEYEHSEGNQMYNFSCLLVCNLMCAVRLSSIKESPQWLNCQSNWLHSMWKSPWDLKLFSTGDSIAFAPVKDYP